MMYDTRTEGVNRSGEVSRFVKQLKYHHGANITEKVVTYKIDSGPSGNIKVEKSDEIIEKLLEHNFSASSLNMYIDCPLKFYFQVVEKIKEEDEVTEQVEPDRYAGVYIKSILPERMKVKLIVIDSHSSRTRLPHVGFPPDETPRHIDAWRYSPPTAYKCVESVFS